MSISAAQHDGQRPRAGVLYENSSVINVSEPGRLVSITVGAYLVSNALYHAGDKPFRSLFRLAAGSYLLYRGISGNCPVSSMLGRKERERHASSVNIRTTLTVDAPREDVYRFWRQLDNLPRFMHHLKKVKVKDDRHSHWQLRLLEDLGTLEWDAEIVEEHEGSLLGWRSLPGSSIETAGKVTFRDVPEGGTELNIVITYRPPAGYVGAGMARLLNPAFESLVRRDLRNFKQIMETEEHGL